MPRWEMRLVSATEDWRGWSIVNDRGVVLVRYRMTGQKAQSASLPAPLRYEKQFGKDIIKWVNAVYKTFTEANGDLTLKLAVKQVAKTSDKYGEQHQATWEDIADAMQESRVELGQRCSEDTFIKNWRPFLDHACDLLRKHKVDNGYELLKVSLRKWNHAPTMKVECGRYLGLFMQFAVARYGVPRSWLITDYDKKELIPKPPSKRLKAAIDDTDLLELIAVTEQQSKPWANVLKLLTQYGLRPEELKHLSVKKHPTNKKIQFWCDYEKVGGAEETEKRWLEPMFLRDAEDQPLTWPLEQLWADGELDLPLGNDGTVIAFNGRRINGFLHRSTTKAGHFWKQLIDKYEDKTPSEWVRPYSFRDCYSVRSHREGVPKASICAAMGHSEIVHDRSYRTMTDKIISRDYESARASS